MRNVRYPIGSSAFLAEQATVVLHGRMGSGKTVATKNFVSAVRREKSDAKILAFSFRKMLASMFAEA